MFTLRTRSASNVNGHQILEILIRAIVFPKEARMSLLVDEHLHLLPSICQAFFDFTYILLVKRVAKELRLHVYGAYDVYGVYDK